ncbi:MAG TPA: surface-adhesin E family protein [Gemmatimonadaceae bacterium]|nr:surface-adhesin E family protein [Gemmatimonadaceae bacterium]
MIRTFLRFAVAGVVALVLAPNDAAAQSAWRTIHSDSRLTVALDTTRIRVSDEGSYIAFVRWDYATPRRAESRRDYTRMVQQVQLKCSPIRVRRIGASLYSSTGRVVEEVPAVSRRVLANMSWDPPRAGSEGARVYPMICQALTRRAR